MAASAAVLCLVLAVVASHTVAVTAVNYVVGYPDAGGASTDDLWDFPGTIAARSGSNFTSYQQWANTRLTKAKGGDTITFRFATGTHAVFRVSDPANYADCNATGTVLGTTSPVVLTLADATTYYIICNVAKTHCTQGMKFTFTTASTPPPPPTAPPPPPGPPGSLTPAPAPPAGSTPGQAPAPSPTTSGTPTPAPAPAPAPGATTPVLGPASAPAPAPGTAGGTPPARSPTTSPPTSPTPAPGPSTSPTSSPPPPPARLSPPPASTPAPAHSNAAVSLFAPARIVALGCAVGVMLAMAL